MGKRLSTSGIFILLSLIWGCTWIPIKIGIEAIPPLLFAGSRFVVAGLALLLMAWTKNHELRLARNHIQQLVTVAILANASTYALLFWALQFVPSGLAAVVSMGLIPVFILAISAIRKEEALTRQKVLAIALGSIGLLILFRSDVADAADSGLRLHGVFVITLSTLSYALGSVYSRPLLRTYSPLLVSSWTFLIGGASLGLASVVAEPLTMELFESILQPKVFASWLYLVVFGSVIAFTLYLRLIRDVSPSKAGMYAYVSPAIAVVVGIVVLDETVDWIDFAAMSLMLASACVALLSTEEGDRRGSEV